MLLDAVAAWRSMVVVWTFEPCCCCCCDDDVVMFLLLLLVDRLDLRSGGTAGLPEKAVAEFWWVEELLAVMVPVPCGDAAFLVAVVNILVRLVCVCVTN